MGAFVLGENYFSFPANPHVWFQRKIKFSGNHLPVDQNLRLWPGNEFIPSFSLQFISGKRERERERERAQIGEHQSTSGAIVRRARSSIDQRRDWRAVRSSNERARRSRSSIVATRCDRSRSTAWSHRSSIDEQCDSSGFVWFVFSFFFSKRQKIFFRNFFEM